MYQGEGAEAAEGTHLGPARPDPGGVGDRTSKAMAELTAGEDPAETNAVPPRAAARVPCQYRARVRTAAVTPPNLVAENVLVQLLRQLVHSAGQFRVLFQQLVHVRVVVIGLLLLEGGLTVLADHHERREEDRLEGDDQGQR